MRRARWLRTLAEAAVVAAASAILALAVNGLRAAGLPLVAPAPYTILVPCPEPGGPVEAIAPTDLGIGGPRTFLIDARGADEFRREHLPGATNVPYDWLDPIPEAELKRLVKSVASSGATRVVVYGDGGRPDSGEHLGREISGAGIRNVGFVRGGAPALFEEGVS
jgi:hypothetical protein